MYLQEKYRNFFLTKRNKYTILDSGYDYGLKYAHSLANLIRAKEIIIPELRHELLKPYKYKYQLIVSDLELVDTYAYEDKYKDISVLGLPISLCETNKEARVQFLEETDYHERFEFHCLDSGEWVNEVHYLKARSISTSYPIYMGQRLIDIEKSNRYYPQPKLYYQSSRDNELVYKNIRYYKRMARK